MPSLLQKAPRERTGGIVLCGGRSSRMGRPKHLLPFGERTLLQVVVETLRGVVTPVVVVRAAEQELPDLPDEVLVTEDEEPDLGPLSGLCAGMTALSGADQPAGASPRFAPVAHEPEASARRLMKTSQSRLNGVGAAFLASCDAPLLNPDVVRFLIASRGEHDVSVVRDGDFLHALAAVYSVRLLPRIRKLLHERQLRLQGLIETSNATIIDANDLRRFDPKLDSFRNVNTPEDYAKLVSGSS